MLSKLLNKLKKVEKKEEVKPQPKNTDRYKNLLDGQSITTVLDNFKEE